MDGQDTYCEPEALIVSKNEKAANLHLDSNSYHSFNELKPGPPISYRLVMPHSAVKHRKVEVSWIRGLALNRDSDYVLINFSTQFGGKLIRDKFLWPKTERSVARMKLLAIELLSDILPRAQFGALDPRDVECKSKCL